MKTISLLNLSKKEYAIKSLKNKDYAVERYIMLKIRNE